VRPRQAGALGVPFASGHKGVLLIPLYILASRLTYSRWGGTAAGAIMGVIGFLQGDGAIRSFGNPEAFGAWSRD